MSDLFALPKPSVGHGFAVQASRVATDRGMVFSAAVLLLLLVLGLRSVLLRHFSLARLALGRRSKLPPGPAGSPIYGNLLQVTDARANGTMGAYFAGLVQYGEMATLRMGTNTWVLLNSDRVAHEIITKNAAVTGERPEFPIASGLVSRFKRTVLRQTEEWAPGRKVMHHLLSGTAVREYAGVLESESVRLLANYLERPESWYQHHYRYAYSIIHRVVAGEKSGHSQKQLDDFRSITSEFLRSINASLVDSFPVLARLPRKMQIWRPRWESVGLRHLAVFREWWGPIQRAINAGTAPPSFVRDVLLRHDRFSQNVEEAMYLATSVVAAGSDNVRMTINGFVMASLCAPAAFRRARADLDRVCGADANRLPDLNDMADLPYLLAMIKEGLRWRPVVPIIPQHHLTEDLHFEGYFFPKGVDFVINSLAVCSECPDPLRYEPERWLDGRVDSITADLWQFGGGRRVCVGYKIAQQELFLAYARLIYCFDFEANGSFDSFNLNHNTGDEPFPVRATVRSQKHADLIARLAAEIPPFE